MKVAISLGWILKVFVSMICEGSVSRWIFVLEPLYARGVVPNMSFGMMEGIYIVVGFGQNSHGWSVWVSG